MQRLQSQVDSGAKKALRAADLVTFFDTLQVGAALAPPLPADAPWFVLHPDNRALAAWDWLIRLLACYFCFEVPWSIAFRVSERLGREYEAANTFLETLLLCDMAINLCRAFYNTNGVLVYRAAAIRRAYVANTFFFDLVAAMPFDWLVVANGHVSEGYVRTPLAMRAVSSKFAPRRGAAEREGTATRVCRWRGCACPR